AAVGRGHDHARRAAVRLGGGLHSRRYQAGDLIARKPSGNADETILGNPRNRPETNREYVWSQQSGGKVRLEAHMNHSIHSLDRSTHLKIVVVALVAGIAVAAVGVAARNNVDYSQTAGGITAD